jgi:RNA polymerase sigma factor (sigma-70 family)
MKTRNPSPEEDFTNLLRQLRDGLRSIDDFFEMIDFARWLRIFCYRYDFTVIDKSYGPEDLFQDCYIKVLESVLKLEPDNTPNVCAFYGWLKTLVYRTFLDKLRASNKAQNHEWFRSDEPVETFDIPAPDVDYDGKCFLSLFLQFIKDLPSEHQRAIKLWLEDDSYREIAETLNDEGIECSHVTVRNWVIASLDGFKENLGLQKPDQPRTRKSRRTGS